jgi:biopolymer transport protein TolR
MGMSTGGAGGGSRHRRTGGSKGVMAEINVTPMVDVMLVLLVIFMVAAPLMTTTIDINLPQARGGTTPEAKAEPLRLAVKKTGGSCNSQIEMLLGDGTPIAASELEAKIKAVGETRPEDERVIFLSGDRDVCYSAMMKMLGNIRAAGFKANMVVLPEDGT